MNMSTCIMMNMPTFYHILDIIRIAEGLKQTISISLRIIAMQQFIIHFILCKKNNASSKS